MSLYTIKMISLTSGATEQNTNYSQNLDEPHKPTTYENYGKL